MKKLFYAGVLVMFCTAHIYAQSLKTEAPPRDFSNTVGISGGAMFFPGRVSHSEVIDQVGLTYERKISSSFFISAGYYIWNTNSGYPNYYLHHQFIVPEYNGYKPGALAERINYHTAEVMPEYRLYFHKHRDVATFGAGVSYTFGENRYIRDIDNYGAELYSNNDSYYGVVCKVAYTHLFLHNRLGVGLETRYRYYFGLNEGEYDTDVNLKVNF